MSKNIRRIGNYLYIVDYNQSVRENGVWAVCGFTNDILKNRNGQKAYKVILSNNPKLIVDGIQEIPTDFLEWFVNNPGCESVEVKDYMKKVGIETDANGYREMDLLKRFYDIEIPQDQPKQTNWLDVNLNCKQVESCSNSLSGKCVCPKQTIEEVAQWVIDNRYAKSELEKVSDFEIYHKIIDGYNHAQNEIEELVSELQNIVDYGGVANFDKLKQLITKHNG